MKCVAHVHSDWSYDGHYSLLELKEIFKRWGVKCLLMSEHDRTFNSEKWDRYQKACDAESDNNFLIIPGIEYSCPNNIIHILVWGNLPFMGAGLEPHLLFDKLQKHKYFAVWAHPEHKKAYRIFDDNWLKFLHGIEIWNRKSNGIKPSRLSYYLAKKHSLILFGGPDFHTLKQAFPLCMHGELKVKKDNDYIHQIHNMRFKVMGIPGTWFIGGLLFIGCWILEWTRKKSLVLIRMAKKRRPP